MRTPRHPRAHGSRRQPLLSEHPWFQLALARLPAARAIAVPLPGRPRRRRRAAAEQLAERVRRSGLDRVTEADGVPGQWYFHAFDSSQPTSTGATPTSRRCSTKCSGTGSTRRRRLPHRRRARHGQVGGAGRLAGSRRRHRRSQPRDVGSVGGARDLPAVAGHRRPLRPRVISSARSGCRAPMRCVPTSPRTSCTRSSPSTSSCSRGMPPACAVPSGERSTMLLWSAPHRLGRSPTTTSTALSPGTARNRTSPAGHDRYHRRGPAAGAGRPRSRRAPCPGGHHAAARPPRRCLPLPGRGLGLPEVFEVPDDARQDPIWVRSGGRQLGRDGCRVPLPWKAGEPTFGRPTASTATWLPQPAWFAEFAVDRQEDDLASTLRLYRTLLDGRREIFRTDASLHWLDAGQSVLAFTAAPDFALSISGTSRSLCRPTGPASWSSHRRRPTNLTPGSSHQIVLPGTCSTAILRSCPARRTESVRTRSSRNCNPQRRARPQVAVPSSPRKEQRCCRTNSASPQSRRRPPCRRVYTEAVAA